MDNHNTVKILAFVILLFSGHVVAEKNGPLLNFKFNHVSTLQTDDYLLNSLSLSNSASSDVLKFAQYDATWTYPWVTQNMNIDLGVTLRHLSGFNKVSETVGNGYFQEVLPLLHASALYSLPLKGLSAGIEGSHLGSNTRQVFDYKAKVSYEWRKGFGLQGGWQHQQFNLESAAENGPDYEKNGPFIDFYLNF